MGKLPRKWKRSKGADWTEMRREEKTLKCTLLNGSAWSTGKKYMRRCKGKCEIFFGIGHRLRKENWRNSSTKRPRKDGDLQRMQQELLRKRKVVSRQQLGSSVYFWYSEGWTPRNEAFLQRTQTTKHPWLIACDADMSPEDFEKSLWFRKDQMHVIAPAGVSTCRSKNAKGELVEKVQD